ncbi:MAG: hypothetical protein H6719_16925 [Sandaracinaceae bacterium]|nr:hypothetical protein [Sandaracinaceae bacterium]
MAAVGATLGELGGQALDAVAARVSEPDPLEEARRALLVRIASAAYVAEPNLLPLIACELVQRSVRLGCSRESAYGFGVFSLTVTAGWMLELGAEHGRIALTLVDRFDARELAGPVQHVVHHFTRAWTGPLASVYDHNAQMYRALMDVGDLEYAGWVLHMRAVYGYLAGVPLDALAEEIEHALEVMRLHDHGAAVACTLPFAHLVARLRGRPRIRSRPTETTTTSRERSRRSRT